jgi:hypothetical protein
MESGAGLDLVARARPKDGRQGIIDLVRLTKADYLLFSFMAYRSHSEIRVGLVTNPDTPPFSNHHHPVSRIDSETDAKTAEEIWLCPRQTGHG